MHAAIELPCPVYPALPTQASIDVLDDGEFEPDGQDVLWLAPDVDTKVPAALFVHVASAVAATDAEYLPAAQSVHAPEPDAVLYFPAMHAAIKLPSPVYPALPTQAVFAELEASEIEFVGQPVHVASAVAASNTENLPAAQSEHV